MWSRLLRALKVLELEERILNTGALLAVLGVFLPWLSGEWLGGESVSYGGLHFYTAFLGIAVLFLNLFILLVTLLPVLGGPSPLRKRAKHTMRLIASVLSTLLILASLSVLIRVTFEFSRMEVRFGVYVTLIGSLLATIYAFLRVQEQRKLEAQEVFRHPEDQKPTMEQRETHVKPPPPPPPPPPLEPEEYHIHTSS